MTIARILRLATCLVALGSVSGCALRPQVTHMAMEYNEFVAQTTNRQTVLNILRAREREPLHFTSFTKVVGTAQLEGTGGFGATVNTNETAKAPVAGILETSTKTFKSDALNPTLGIKVDTGTDFEIAINSTDDFWKGILEPVSPAMLVYYLRQGWDASLISYLFIDRMDYTITIKPKPSRTGSSEKTAKSDEQDTQLIVSVINEPARKSGPTVDPDAPKTTLFDRSMRCRPLGFSVKPASSRLIPISSVADLQGVTADVLAKVKTPDEVKAAKAEGDKGKPALGESATGDGAKPQATAKASGSPAKSKAANEKTVAPSAPAMLAVDESEPQDYGLVLGDASADGACRSIETYLARKVASAIPATESSNATKEILKEATGVADFAYAPAKSDYAFNDLTTLLNAKLENVSITRLLRDAPKGLDARAGGVQFKGEGLCNAFVDADHYTCDVNITLTLRSIEGVIYYLGEIQRANAVPPMLRDRLWIPASPPSGADVSAADADSDISIKYPATRFHYDIPILTIETAKQAQGSKIFAYADFDGDRWVVPASGQDITKKTGYSSEVITLVEQILNLYRSSKDFPSTPFVKVLN